VIAGGQRSRQPGSSGVAGRTGSRPARCHVIRIRGSCEVRLVAAIAGRRCAGKDIIDVTQNAGNSCMRARQRKWRVVVIEGRARPVYSRVTRIAGGGEARRGVRWVVGAIPIRLMTAVARRWQSGVVVIYMAG